MQHTDLFHTVVTKKLTILRIQHLLVVSPELASCFPADASAVRALQRHNNNIITTRQEAVTAHARTSRLSCQQCVTTAQHYQPPQTLAWLLLLMHTSSMTHGSGYERWVLMLQFGASAPWTCHNWCTTGQRSSQEGGAHGDT